MFELETLGDVVALLKTKEARDNGVEDRVFHRNGILSLEGVALELRRRGYEVEVFEARGGAGDTPSRRALGRCSPAQEAAALVSGPAAAVAWPVWRGGLT